MKKKDCSKMTFKKDLNGALRDAGTGRFTPLIKALKESVAGKILCSRCAGILPLDQINVEGHLHHGRPYECLDRKSCEKRRKS